VIENNIAVIANILWKESLKNIGETLSDSEISSFNMNDYYYLTEIYNLGRPKLGELADKLNLTKPAISALVKRLEKNNLITKDQSNEDKRIYYLNLTDKGRNIIEGDNKSYLKLSKVLHSLLTKEQIKEVDTLLEKIVETLNE
jgi:Transcriptional regulators